MTSGKRQLGFIVRAEQQAKGWLVLLHDLKTGEQMQFDSLEACTQKLLDLAKANPQERRSENV